MVCKLYPNKIIKERMKQLKQEKKSGLKLNYGIGVTEEISSNLKTCQVDHRLLQNNLFNRHTKYLASPKEKKN